MDSERDRHLDPKCKKCEKRDCANCTRFGRTLLLTDPGIPWLYDGPLERPKTRLPWEALPDIEQK